MSMFKHERVKLDSDAERYAGHTIRAVRHPGTFRYRCEVDGVALLGERALNGLDTPIRLWANVATAIAAGRKHVREAQKGKAQS